MRPNRPPSNLPQPQDSPFTGSSGYQPNVVMVTSCLKTFVCLKIIIRLKIAICLMITIRLVYIACM
jgi:hypothetical protein